MGDSASLPGMSSRGVGRACAYVAVSATVAVGMPRERSSSAMIGSEVVLPPHGPPVSTMRSTRGGGSSGGRCVDEAAATRWLQVRARRASAVRAIVDAVEGSIADFVEPPHSTA